VLQLRRARHGHRPDRDPFGHLRYRPLEPVEWAKYPDGERPGEDDGQDEQAHATECHPSPGTGDVERGCFAVHADHDGRDELTVAAYAGSGEDRVRVPRENPGPGWRRLVDERTLGCSDHLRGGCIEPAGGQGAAVGVDDEDFLAIHLPVAVEERLEWGRAGCRVGECRELTPALLREGRRTPVGRAQREGDRERGDRQQRQKDEHDPDAASHLNRPAGSRSRARSAVADPIRASLGSDRRRSPGSATCP
jgi:hypothetical protein